VSERLPKPILQVERLATYFNTEAGIVRAVDGVNLEVMPGEVLGLVGESGCGKTMTGLSILGLVDPPGQIVAGRVVFEGHDLLRLSTDELSRVRGAGIGMILQQPKTSLDPLMRIGDQIAAVLRRNNRIARRKAWREAINLLSSVGIPAPDEKACAYPHQISGGQAQRVMIAIALALRPSLLIADEPTTALDVTVQAQVLSLLKERCRDLGTALILITHDLGVIAQMADRVAVMYAGRIVEEAETLALFEQPRHPYTRGLLGATPILGRREAKLIEIPGTVPNLIDPSPGCRFAARCELYMREGHAACVETEPPFSEVVHRHRNRCWLDQLSSQHARERPLAVRGSARSVAGSK
jgi:peptide/nickel transport system ATP-binding protein